MTPLRQAASDYLALRRALGFKLRANEDALIEFTDFLDRRGVTTITAAAAVEWALSKPSLPVAPPCDRDHSRHPLSLHAALPTSVRRLGR